MVRSVPKKLKPNLKLGPQLGGDVHDIQTSRSWFKGTKKSFVRKNKNKKIQIKQMDKIGPEKKFMNPFMEQT